MRAAVQTDLTGESAVCDRWVLTEGGFTAAQIWSLVSILLFTLDWLQISVSFSCSVVRASADIHGGRQSCIELIGQRAADSPGSTGIKPVKPLNYFQIQLDNSCQEHRATWNTPAGTAEHRRTWVSGKRASGYGKQNQPDLTPEVKKQYEQYFSLFPSVTFNFEMYSSQSHDPGEVINISGCICCHSNCCFHIKLIKRIQLSVTWLLFLFVWWWQGGGWWWWRQGGGAWPQGAAPPQYQLLAVSWQRLIRRTRWACCHPELSVYRRTSDNRSGTLWPSRVHFTLVNLWQHSCLSLFSCPPLTNTESFRSTQTQPQVRLLVYLNKA